MAIIDDLRTWFERDLKFATWEENVKVDDSQSEVTTVSFYTETNEYTLTITAKGEGVPLVEAEVKARKARAGQATPRGRHLVPPQRVRLNDRTWKRILGHIVGLELVRVQRRDIVAAADEAGTRPAARVPRSEAAGTELDR